MTPVEAHAVLEEMAGRVDVWDAGVVRQAVLAVGLSGPFSANAFRDRLPETGMGAVGLVMRRLASKSGGRLLVKHTTAEGYPVTEPSTAASTHGKPLQVWRLSGAGRAAAVELFGEQGAAA